MALFLPINKPQRSDVLPNTRSNNEGATEQNEAMSLVTQPFASNVLSSAALDDTEEIASTSRAQGNKPSKKRDQGMTRANRRLKPHEEDPSRNLSSGHRFAWNVGYFLDDVLGSARDKGWHNAEHMVQGIFRAPRTSTGTSAEEDWELVQHPGKDVDWRKYRDVRARIFIGCALIYEHNLRGFYLNRVDGLHVTCRPNLRSKFTYVNFGKSQAQMINMGTDVSTSSWIFECVEELYLPNMKNWRVNFENLVTQYGTKIDETVLSAYHRREIYCRFLQYLYAHNPPIPAHLFFAINAYDVYDAPYEIDATFKDLVRATTSTAASSSESQDDLGALV